MSAGREIILHGNEVFALEVRGFDQIPKPERNTTLRHVDYLWVGTSLNLLGFALGAIAIVLGGADLSWILGLPVSMMTYWILTARFQVRFNSRTQQSVQRPRDGAPRP